MDAWERLFRGGSCTPHEVVTKLNTELRKIIDSPEIKAKSATLGFEAFSSSPEELGKFNEVQLVKWTKMIKRTPAFSRNDPAPRWLTSQRGLESGDSMSEFGIKRTCWPS